MSFVYSSNSPEFLDYIASCKSRDEILADPRLCILLNDPHIKDNMELALLARAADYGTYENKKEFIGFLLANGPELDTDTIMYYRDKILSDKEYSTIAREEFQDIEVIDDLRINVYNKTTANSISEEDDDGNCFNNPCNYLQPITANMGLIGDSENFITLGNIFSRKAKKSEDSKKVEKTKKETESKEEDSDTIWGNIRKHNISRIIPAFEKGYRTMLKDVENKMSLFFDKVSTNNLEKLAKTSGDNQAEDISKNISTAIKLNIFANMGDCARLWEHMRRLRLYDSNSNAKGPMDDSSLNTSKTILGTPKVNDTARNDTALRYTPPQSATAGLLAKMGKRNIVDIVKEIAKSQNRTEEEAIAIASSLLGYDVSKYYYSSTTATNNKKS